MIVWSPAHRQRVFFSLSKNRIKTLIYQDLGKLKFHDGRSDGALYLGLRSPGFLLFVTLGKTLATPCKTATQLVLTLGSTKTEVCLCPDRNGNRSWFKPFKIKIKIKTIGLGLGLGVFTPPPGIGSIHRYCQAPGVHCG